MVYEGVRRARRALRIVYTGPEDILELVKESRIFRISTLRYESWLRKWKKYKEQACIVSKSAHAVHACRMQVWAADFTHGSLKGKGIRGATSIVVSGLAADTVHHDPTSTSRAVASSIELSELIKVVWTHHRQCCNPV